MDFLIRAAAALLALACAVPCHASLIAYSATHIDAATWRYDYDIANDTLAVPVDEFTIYFDRSLYANLRAAAGAPDWDLLVVQPDLALPDDGFLDALSLGLPLAVDAALSGFSILFDFLGSGTPGSQPFDFIDAASFTVIDSASTVLRAPVVSVPEPATWTLLLIGLAAAARRARSPAASRNV